jgi:TorA maturation chaperone TorD
MLHCCSALRGSAAMQARSALRTSCLAKQPRARACKLLNGNISISLSGSYYLTGFLNERPLARLRDDLAEFGVERVDGHYEPEDHAATLCEIMSAFAGGRFAAPEGAQRRLFEKHMAPWMGRFFADLERANGADFYRHVGTLGRTFFEIEAEAFALPD